jgi:hypothetical protein
MKKSASLSKRQKPIEIWGISIKGKNKWKPLIQNASKKS